MVYPTIALRLNQDMNEASLGSIKVTKGTCLSSIDCIDLQYDFIPYGEEINESASVNDYPDSASSRMPPISASQSVPSLLQCSLVPQSSTSTSSANHSTMLCRPTRFGASKLYRTGSLVQPLSKLNNHMEEFPLSTATTAAVSPVDDLSACHCATKSLVHRSVCCHILRSVSVGHLDCLVRSPACTSSHSDQLKMQKSFPHSSPPPPLTVSPGYDQQLAALPSTDSHQSPDLAAPVTVVSSLGGKLVDRAEAGGGYDSRQPSVVAGRQVWTSSVWWLAEQTGGEANRKAIFCLGTSPEGAKQLVGPPDVPHVDSLVSDRHLLLPGYSEFEDEMTREVAQFELCNFLISQLEYIDASAQLADEHQRAAAAEATNTPSSPPRSLSFTANSLRPRDRPGSPQCSHWNLGFLVFDHDDKVETKQRCYKDWPTAKHSPVKSKTLSVFPNLFGVIHQGVFVDPNMCSSTEDNESVDASRTDLSTPRGYLPSLANVSSQCLQPTRSRLAVNLSTKLVDSCLNTKQVGQLKNLRQLLADTCDYDWAHQRCEAVRSYFQAMNCTCEVATSCSVSPSVQRHPNDLPSGEQSPRRPCVLQSMPSRRASTAAVNSRAISSNSVSSLTSQPVRFMAEHPSCRASPTLPFNPQACKMNCKIDPSGFSSTVKEWTGNAILNAICAPVPYSLFVNPPIEKSRRKVILSEQRNRCAGCGCFVESRYLKRMRFCELFNKFFCTVCHSNTLMVLPGSVLTSWDFRMLPVSNMARDRLNQLHYQPLLRLSDFNRRVLQNQSALQTCSILRRQGNRILPFMSFCQEASQLLVQVYRLPSHWITSPDLWSMADLCATRNGELARQLRSVFQPVVDHVSACLRCQAQGYICEICHTGRILFPFGQANTAICPTCMACFHRTCLRNPRPENCPRCLRRAMCRSRQRQRQVHHQKLMKNQNRASPQRRFTEARSNWQPQRQFNDADWDIEQCEVVNCADQETGESMPLNF